MPFNTRPDPLMRPVLTGGQADGLNWQFEEVLGFVRARDMRRFRIPIGATTDQLSSPRFLWSMIPPCGADYVPAAWLHDAGYRGTLETTDDGGLTWYPANLTQAECDDLLREAMDSLRIEPGLSLVIYEALRAFGAKAFREDRAAKADAVVPAVVPPVPPALK